ncbi:hypothetical protein RJ639_023530 [Escallonia herrerae]|uniref:Uncharacterized protein n=1 Tax=Escallonia herrerae TaxID=1293975 RepID=A0AA88V3G3_9ASTE|nr:hypothetical protein RJ639_023530 [Escallonia herrerae]
MSVGAATFVVAPVNEKVVTTKCVLYLVYEFAAGDHACNIYPIEVGPGAPAKAVPSLRSPTALPKPVLSFSFDHHPVCRGYFAIGHLIYMVGGKRETILKDVTVFDTVTCSVRQASPMVYPKYDPTIVGPIRAVWDDRDRDPDVKETWRCFVIVHELTSHDFEALDVQFFHSGREPTSRWTSLPQPPVSRVERPPLLATVTGYRIHSHAIIKDNNVILLATFSEGMFSYHVSESIWARIDCPSPGPSTRIRLPFWKTATFFGPLGGYIACSPEYYPGIGCKSDYCAFRPYGPEPECLIAHEGKSAPKGSYNKIPICGLPTVSLARVDDVFVSNLSDERGVCVVRQGVDDDHWGFGSNQPFDLTRISRPLTAIDVFYPSMNPSGDAISANDQFSVSFQIGLSWFPLARVRACLPVFTMEKSGGKHRAEVEESIDLQPRKRAKHMEQARKNMKEGQYLARSIKAKARGFRKDLPTLFDKQCLIEKP